MKKIILAFDGVHFSHGAFEFANVLNEREKILLVGVFLPNVSYSNLWSYSGAGVNGPSYIPPVEIKDEEVVERNIEKFEALCQKNDIEYRVHKDVDDFALPELIKETRFADLFILGSESFYKNLGTYEPNEYLQNALHGVECPVIVVPEKYKFPETNILAYDGSDSSVYAIKQFAYLFGDLLKNPTIVIYIKENGEKQLPDQVNIEELVARHFSDITFSKLSNNPLKYFNSWLLEKKSAFLVCGSYGRSGIYRIFHKSFVSDIIKDHRIPVFIAHQK